MLADLHLRLALAVGLDQGDAEFLGLRLRRLGDADDELVLKVLVGDADTVFGRGR